MLPYKIKAQVIKGMGRGRKIGIPTINFQIPKYLSLAHGVYAAKIHCFGESYPAALHFGPRPVFSESEPTLEAHILTPITKVPSEAEIEFVQYIRKIRNFKNTEGMLERIKEDVTQIKQALSP